MIYEEWIQRSISATKDAKKILSKHESSPSRVITVEKTYNELSKLSLKQDDLLRQSLRCIENGLNRAAHILCWAAFIDFLHVKIDSDGFNKINSIRPKWKITCIEDLRDYSDFQMIEALYKMNFISRADERTLKGLLNDRNECAHPSEYYPELNESLGYISKILKLIKRFQKKNIKKALSGKTTSSDR